MKYIQTNNAPQALGPYSQAITVNSFVFCSGQIGIDPKTGVLISDGIEEQTDQVMKNIQGILKECGCTLMDIVKTTIFLKNLQDFSQVNTVYERRLQGHKPARATIGAHQLPLDARIEIECIARIP